MKRQYKLILFGALLVLIAISAMGCIIVDGSGKSNNSSMTMDELRTYYTPVKVNENVVYVEYKGKLTLNDKNTLVFAVVGGLIVCYDSSYAQSGKLLAVIAEVDKEVYVYHCEYDVFKLYIDERIDEDTLFENIFFKKLAS